MPYSRSSLALMLIRSAARILHKRSDDARDDGGGANAKRTHELECLVMTELRQWRSQVDVGGGGTLCYSSFPLRC